MAEPIHAHFDGNFTIKHERRAGTSTTGRCPIIKRVLSDAGNKAFAADAGRSDAQAGSTAPVVSQMGECNDFRADKALGRDSVKHDITGVGGLFCRHGFLLLLLNMYTGERWSYATYMLYMLLAVYGVQVSHFWYDINCRYGAHFKRWCNGQHDLPAAVLAAMAAINFPVPPFHLSAHKVSCQLLHSAREMLKAGRGSGKLVQADKTMYHSCGAQLASCTHRHLCTVGYCIDRLMLLVI